MTMRPINRQALLDEARKTTQHNQDLLAQIIATLDADATPPPDPPCQHEFEAEDDKGWRCKRCGCQT